MTTLQQTFLNALLYARRAPEIHEADDIFGWMIGSWEIDALLHWPDKPVQKIRGEVHATWVLEGRAIQDLFIFPRRADRMPWVHAQGDRYATTIRTFDRARNAWRVNFINPAADETSAQLTARRNGNDILLEGKLADNTPVRWCYYGPTKTAFHYTAERQEPDGKSWRLYLELFGKRVEV